MQEEPQVLTNTAAATHLRSLLTQLPREPPTAPNLPISGTTRPNAYFDLADRIITVRSPIRKA